MLDFKIKTFGCKVNTYDSGLLQKRLAAAGFTPSDQPSIHILNTCAVTAEATKEAMRTVRKLKVENPFSTVVITGCAAQVDTDLLANVKGADLIVANSHKGNLEEIIKAYLRGDLKERVIKSNIFKKEDLEGGGGTEWSHTRAFLKIQDGCNSFCTFCVIPFARGKSRSLPVKSLIRRINEIHQSGVEEVVLTGVHIGDYLDDSDGKEARLEDLVEQVLARTNISRLRLSSLEPIELSPRLMECFKDERLCPHFHMSIQSANTRVLSSMKRNYTAEDVETALTMIQKGCPGAFVGMDVIAGFPGETEEEFADTYSRLSDLPWTRIHVFPYSPRPGTFAMRIKPHLSRQEIMERAARLRALSFERHTQAAQAQVGRIKKVLALKKGAHGGHGLSRDYWPVKIATENSTILKNETEVQITGFEALRRGGQEVVLTANFASF